MVRKAFPAPNTLYLDNTHTNKEIVLRRIEDVKIEHEISESYTPYKHGMRGMKVDSVATKQGTFHVKIYVAIDPNDPDARAALERLSTLSHDNPMSRAFELVMRYPEQTNEVEKKDIFVSKDTPTTADETVW